MEKVVDELELGNFLNLINKTYGYDFSGYSQASLLRRINRFLINREIYDFSEFSNVLIEDESLFEEFLQELTVNVTEMFRDPSFFKALREQVINTLQTYPHIKIWDAGCSTGEELYSLAIMLSEEGIYNKSRIYATDINQKVLYQAREGIFSLSSMREYTENYFNAGGSRSLSDYYTARYDRVVFNSDLKRNIVFSAHNLATDTSFNEFNLIVCRNVLIYFKKELQDRVIKLFLESLPVFGYLALGNKESLVLSKYKDHFEIIDRTEKIYRRIK
jgi:chemotaxis protein methyltransferase CheR